MSVQLLDKTRKINRLLHNNNSSKVVFNDICGVLSEILLSNVLVISRKGKVLGISQYAGVEEINELIEDRVGLLIDPLLNTQNNIKGCHGLITPINIAGERLGTLFMYKYGQDYDIDDIILGEYGTTVVGLEMMRSVHDENVEEERRRQVVRSAIGTLSVTELEAIFLVFREMKGNECVLVASKIADKAGITRSVIVNALRKFESAGVIESRSSGMKGTSIKVLNDCVFEELETVREQKQAGKL